MLARVALPTDVSSFEAFGLLRLCRHDVFQTKHPVARPCFHNCNQNIYGEADGESQLNREFWYPYSRSFQILNG